MALGTAAILGLAGGVAQGALANKAANAQERASQDQLALQREMWDTTRQDMLPFRESGGNALAAYMSELGLGDAPEGYQGISLSPAAQFAMEQGRNAMESGAAARGGLYSGATLGGLEEMRFGMAQQDRASQMNRLAGLTDMGLSAAGMNASNNNAMAQMGSNAFANMGNARAAGAIGMGNAFTGMMNNLSGQIGYQKVG